MDPKEKGRTGEGESERKSLPFVVLKIQNEAWNLVELGFTVAVIYFLLRKGQK